MCPTPMTVSERPRGWRGWGPSVFSSGGEVEQEPVGAADIGVVEGRDEVTKPVTPAGAAPSC